MTQVLEVPQFAQHHRVAQVQVRAAGVAAQLDFQRPIILERPLQLSDQLIFRNDLFRPPPQQVHLFIDARKCHYTDLCSFMVRASCRLLSRSATAWRLSCCCLPRQTANSTFAQPPRK